jgi:hypothetical protein
MCYKCHISIIIQAHLILHLTHTRVDSNDFTKNLTKESTIKIEEHILHNVQC